MTNPEANAQSTTAEQIRQHFDALPTVTAVEVTPQEAYTVSVFIEKGLPSGDIYSLQNEIRHKLPRVDLRIYLRHANMLATDSALMEAKKELAEVKARLHAYESDKEATDDQAG